MLFNIKAFKIIKNKYLKISRSNIILNENTVKQLLIEPIIRLIVSFNVDKDNESDWSLIII